MGIVTVDANLAFNVIVKVEPSVAPGATYVPNEEGRVDTAVLKL